MKKLKEKFKMIITLEDTMMIVLALLFFFILLLILLLSIYFYEKIKRLENRTESFLSERIYSWLDRTFWTSQHFTALSENSRNST